MAEAHTSSSITSASTLRAARAALCALFTTCGIDTKEWFWYAEVGLYGKSEEWWPRLGRKCRTEDGNTVSRNFDYVVSTNGRGEPERPKFYKSYYKSTTQQGVLSVVT